MKSFTTLVLFAVLPCIGITNLIHANHSFEPAPMLSPKLAGSFTNPNYYWTQPNIRNGSATWQDSSGNFWLFGGFHRGKDYSGHNNDLWRYSQSQNSWTRISGPLRHEDTGKYSGTDLYPAARKNATCWTDSSGNFWMYGGSGSDYLTVYSDLWKYEPALNKWTLVNGTDAHGVSANYAGPVQTPGGRENSQAWIDNQGNLCLYGGYSSYDGNGMTFGDLWKFNVTTNQWIFVHGSQGINPPAQYGGGNKTPGGRAEAATWIDGSNNLWLFGGRTRTAYYNDMWKFDTVANTWTFIAGTSSTGSKGAYPDNTPVGDPHIPAARIHSQFWKDGDGKFWIFGGQFYNSFEVAGTVMIEAGNLNDLWKFDPTTSSFTHISGISNSMLIATEEESPALKPGGTAFGQFWKDNQSNIWIYSPKKNGMSGEYSDNHPRDFWKLTPSTNTWQTVRPEIAVPEKPPARTAAASWNDPQGNLWLYGGGNDDYTYSTPQSDLWKYAPSTQQWEFVSETTDVSGLPVYTGSAPHPGGRYQAASWTGKNNDAYLFGGYINNRKNDFWRYDIAANSWTFLSGSTEANAAGIYSGGNAHPGARNNASTTVDSSGDLWLFGGYYYDNMMNYGSFNDLWKYSVTAGKWQCIYGDGTLNPLPVYAGELQAPGGRIGANLWVDNTNTVWLYGGEETNSTNNGKMSDLWKFKPNTGKWEFVTGPQSSGNFGSGFPGGRANAAAWMDQSQNLWLYGGDGFSQQDMGHLSDIWKFSRSTNQWTLEGGSENADESPVPSGSNANPGGRYSSSVWTKSDNTFWLFGGTTFAHPNSTPYLNDLWKFNPGTRAWVPTNNDPGGPIDPPVSADLSITISAYPIYVEAGNPVTLTVQLKNNSANPAGNPVVDISLPAGVIGQSVENAFSNIATISDTNIKVSPASIDANATITFTATVLVQAEANPALVPITASVSSANPDPLTVNNNQFAYILIDKFTAGCGPDFGFDLPATPLQISHTQKTSKKGAISTIAVTSQINIANVGSAVTPKSSYTVYLSDDPQFSPTTDQLLLTKALGGIKPEKLKKAKLKIKLPTNLIPTDKYVIIVLGKPKTDGTPDECRYSNNFVVSVKIPPPATK